MTQPQTVTLTTDNGEHPISVSWTPLREDFAPKAADVSHITAGGWLTGDAGLIRESIDYLNNNTGAMVLWYDYSFTPEKNHPADIIAAFMAVAGGKFIVNDAGWDILHNAIPELVAPENNRDDVDY